MIVDHFIGGERVASEERFEDRSPIDGAVIAEVSRGGAAEADAAVNAAHAAFAAWAALGPAGRAPYLHRLANLIDANVERLAEVECTDMAMLLRSLRARVIARGARNYRAYADLAVAYEERDWRSNGTWNRVQRMPAGPAAVITPVERAVHALDLEDGAGAGRGLHDGAQARRVVAAELLAARRPDRRGRLPARRVQHRPGHRRGDRARALVAHPLLRRVSFTGSPETGRQIGVAAAANLVPFTAELGGKGPLIVFEDADLEAAAKKAAGQYDDSGQVCLAGTRLLVQDSVRDAFLERFHAHVDEHVLGDPREDATTISPLIHPDHLARVEGFVERARAAGDTDRAGRRSRRRPALRADPDRAALERLGDRPARGLRPGADPAGLRDGG